MELSTYANLYDSPENTEINAPKIIGYYSLDGNKNYLDNLSEMKFVAPQDVPLNSKTVHMDLNVNIEGRTAKKYSLGENMNHLINYFTIHREDVDIFSKKAKTLKDAPILTGSGTLRTICRIPYEVDKDTEMSVFLINGVIYIYHIDEEKDSNKKLTVKENIMSSWGYKFEQYLVSNEESGKPDPFTPNNENFEFNLIFKSGIGKHDLYYRAEMDGVIDDKNFATKDRLMKNDRRENVIEHLNQRKFIEIKTSKINPKMEKSYTFTRFKTFAWYMQSYLTKVDTLVAGYRDDNGIVSLVKSYKLPTILRMRREWEKDVCLNYLNHYLTFVKQVLEDELKKGGHVVGENVDVRSYPMINIVLSNKPRGMVKVRQPGKDEGVQILSREFRNAMNI